MITHSRSFAWLFAALFALAACGGSTETSASVASVSLSPGAAQVVVGTTQLFTATAKDAKGNALTGRAIRWISSDNSIASIASDGLLSGIAPGTATITAESEGQHAIAVVTVLPVPVASIVVSPGSATIGIAATQLFTATARDAFGNTLFGRNVTWSSSDITIATIAGNGLLTAIAAGTVQVTATAEGKTATATLTVAGAPPTPTIASITPGTLVAGTNATIVGTNFETVAANNVVTFDGVVAPIVSASATQLVVSTPCIESGPASVRVVSRGVASTPATVPFTVPSRSLAVGEALVLTNNTQSICNELVTSSPTARYLITVFSSSTSPNTTADFDFGGNSPLAGATVPVVTAPLTALGTSLLEAPAEPDLADEKAQDAAHWAMLERNRADYERLKSYMRPASAVRAARLSALPEIGDTRNLYYTFVAGCADTTRVIPGVAIYVGSKAIIWEDTTNVLRSANSPELADYYRRLGEIFDRDQYESVKRTFGDPLLRDAALDNDGRVHMVFTQRLNGSGAAAYVINCDQAVRVPGGPTAGSNFGEFFYGSVPTALGSNLNNTANPDGWFNFMARTVVHEVKHIASFSARTANNAPTLESSWLEEGTARHAEEMWVRESLHHTEWKANNTFGTAATNGLYCDFTPQETACMAADPLRRPSYGMRRHFNEIREKLLQPWNYSPYGDASTQGNSTFYQTAWSLVRYTIDRYASSDASFFHALINSNTNGVTNLSAVAGVSLDQLIGGWGLALYADDYPGLANPSPDIQFPSWNLRSIYANLNTTPGYTTRFTTPYPILPTQLPFGPFTSRVTGLRGGAHAYFEMSGSTVPVQLLSIRAPGGGAPSNLLRLAIARLQ